MTNYEYDLDRRLLRAVRPDGETVNLSYRAAGGRLSEIAHPNGSILYEYEPGTGRLASMEETTGGSTLTYVYDGSLVLAESFVSPAFSGSVSRTYDDDFRVAEERVNGADPVTVGYDDDSLPTAVGQLVISRSPATGIATGTTLGSVTTTTDRNAFAEPIRESASIGGVEALAFDYTRDRLGRITEIRETIDGVETARAFTYDSSGRLTDVRVGPTVVAHWEYDGNSNRLSATTPSGTVTAEYDAQDRLLRYGDATFTYTANGELATRTEHGAVTRYEYDALGNLRRVELPDGRVIDYLIDARNRRVGKLVDGVLVQAFLYRDQLEPVAELDGTGNVVSRFVYATKSHSPDYMIRDGRTYRIVTDHLGSPRLVINVDTGAVVQEMRFDEWGMLLEDTNPDWQPFGFAGGIWDSETGLVRFGARDYSPEFGRWTAKDPIWSGTNGFQYASSDPVNFVDETGLTEMPATNTEPPPRTPPRAPPSGPSCSVCSPPRTGPGAQPGRGGGGGGLAAAGWLALTAGYEIGYATAPEGWLRDLLGLDEPTGTPIAERCDDNDSAETDNCKTIAAAVQLLCMRDHKQLPAQEQVALCKPIYDEALERCRAENPTIH